MCCFAATTFLSVPTTVPTFQNDSSKALNFNFKPILSNCVKNGTIEIAPSPLQWHDIFETPFFRKAIDTYDSSHPSIGTKTQCDCVSTH